MNDQERIARLEAEVAYLRREKSVAVSALETAAALGHFHTTLSKLTSVLPLLEETAVKVRSLIRFRSVGIYLVNEDDADFYLAYADPPDGSEYLERETRFLIEEGTFAWVLQRDKPLVVSSSDQQGELLLCAISTAARSRGMFIGLLDQEKKDILDTSYALLSIILLSSAQVIESFELYRFINDINTELKEHVAKLAESEKCLLEHRNRLEEEVAERTRDLTHANAQLQNEVAERKRAQRELITERDFIAAVLDTAGALVVVLDRDGNILRFNRACELASGYQAAEVLGRAIWDLIIPEAEIPVIKTVFSQLKAGNFPNSYEGFWLSRSGARRLISWNNSAILGPGGVVEFIIGTGIDNTEKKSAEAALRDSEARFRAVFMMAGIGIVLRDMSGRFIDCNPMFLSMLGYSRHELFQRSLRDILYEEDQPLDSSAGKLLLEGTHATMTQEKRYRRKDAHLRLGKTTMTLVRNHKREPQYYVDLVEDVTEARAMQDALRQAEQTYRNIFENAVEGIFIASPQGTLLKVNPAMARMLGYKSAQSLLRHNPEFLATAVDPESRTQLLEALRDMAAVTNFELQVLRRDQRKIWVSVSAWSASGTGGTVLRLEGLMEDITERKLSEIQLQHKATIDELTGIPNRYLFQERLEQAVAQAERMQQRFALFYLDLDDFKHVNDSHGHHVGDLLLAEAAERLKVRVRSSDTPARVGGDEFTLLLANVRSDKDVEKIARDLVHSLKEPYHPEGIRCVIGASIGISLYPDDGTTPDELMRHADAAMYSAKQNGGNGYCFYTAVCGKIFDRNAPEASEQDKPRR